MMRVAALLPAATEIVHAVGACHMIAGVSHDCDFPAGAANRPRLTRSVVAPDGTPAEIDAAVRAQPDGDRPLFRLDEGALTALHPDVIITQAVCEICAVAEHDVRALAPCGFSLTRDEEEGRALLALDDWTWADGCDVWAVDGIAFVSRPGPRVVDGIEVFASIFHPSLFSPPSPSAALRLVSSRAG